VLNLKYSLMVEATEDPNFFGFFSPDLKGFSGIGHSVEDCLYQARWGSDRYLGYHCEISRLIDEAKKHSLEMA